jgi:ATP-dependent DNA helicase PIF1
MKTKIAELTLNEKQNEAYQRVVQAIDKHESGFFFINAGGETGKTYTLNALLANVRSKKCVALAVASSGIASLLLDGGRTAHSRFKIPLHIRKNSTCSMSKRNSAIKQLLQRCRLIVWDEAPMMHRHTFEALDRSLRDMTGKKNEIFGGIPIVLSGDFKQILPVIKRGGKAQIIHASLKQSSLWKFAQELPLTANVRIELRNIACSMDVQEAESFNDFLNHIGDGTYPTHPDMGPNLIEILSRILAQNQELKEFIKEIYPDLETHSEDSIYKQQRVILTTKNSTVDRINEYVIDKFPGESHTFFSADSLEDDDNKNAYTPEFLNTLNLSGLPPHKLILKKNATIILLRNLNPRIGACNGTRLNIDGFSDNLMITEHNLSDCKGHSWSYETRPKKTLLQ